MSGPATEKAHLPNCVLLRLTAAARVVEERSWRTFESAEANTIRSERYDGHRRCISSSVQYSLNSATEMIVFISFILCLFPLTSIWSHLRCDVSLAEEEY